MDKFINHYKEELNTIINKIKTTDIKDNKTIN